MSMTTGKFCDADCRTLIIDDKGERPTVHYAVGYLDAVLHYKGEDEMMDILTEMMDDGTLTNNQADKYLEGKYPKKKTLNAYNNEEVS